MRTAINSPLARQWTLRHYVQQHQCSKSASSTLLSLTLPRHQQQVAVRLFSSSSTATPFHGAPRSPTGSEHGSSNSSHDMLWQRFAVALRSGITAVADPTRADAVAALGDLTGSVALRNMYETMMADPTGQWILRDRPIVSKGTLPMVDTGAVSDDDDDVTFGQAYGRFLKEHGFDPDGRDPVHYLTDPDLAYVMLRYRQCHDFWHVLTGLPPTVLGELGLKWLELLQTGLPVAALSATVGPWTLLDAKERTVLHKHYLPWAIQMSRQSTYLLNVYYEKEWDTNLKELRKRLNIEVAPSFAF